MYKQSRIWSAGLLLGFLGLLCFGPPAQARLFKRLDWKVEKYMGKAAKADMAGSFGFSQNVTLQENIRRLGKDLTDQGVRPDTVEEFHVVDSPEVNAFAAPGGYVFITRGLLERINSEDELAGVMGHEWGHVDAKHGSRNIKRWPLEIALGLVARKHLGSTGQRVMDAAMGLYGLHYSRESEYQADSLGVKYLHQTGHDPIALGDFFLKLEAGSPMAGLHKLEVAFSSHPRTMNRYEAVKREVKAKAEDVTVQVARLHRLNNRGQVVDAFAMLNRNPNLLKSVGPLALSIASAVGANSDLVSLPPLVLPQGVLLAAENTKTDSDLLNRALASVTLPSQANFRPGVSYAEMSAFLGRTNDDLEGFEDTLDPLMDRHPEWQKFGEYFAYSQHSALGAAQAVEELKGAYNRAERVLLELRSSASLGEPASPALAKNVKEFLSRLPISAEAQVTKAVQAQDNLRRLFQSNMSDLTLTLQQASFSEVHPNWILRDSEQMMVQAANNQDQTNAQTAAVRQEIERLLAGLLDFDLTMMGAVERRALPTLLAHRLVVSEEDIKILLGHPHLKLSDIPYITESRKRGLLPKDRIPKNKELASLPLNLADMDVLFHFLRQDLLALSRKELGITPDWVAMADPKLDGKARQALSELMVGQALKADEIYTELLTAQPKASITLLVQAAQAKFLTGNPKAARQLLSKALKQNPNHTKVLNLMGLYAQSPQKRMDWWKKSLAKNPNQPIVASRLVALTEPKIQKAATLTSPQ